MCFYHTHEPVGGEHIEFNSVGSVYANTSCSKLDCSTRPAGLAGQTTNLLQWKSKI